MAIDVMYDVILNRLREKESGGSSPCVAPVNFINKTYAEMLALEVASDFIQGSFYNITDRDIVIQATNKFKLALNGSYIDTNISPPEINYIEYDLTNDLIIRRRDIRGNDVCYSKQYLDSLVLAYDTIQTTFSWGDNDVYGNVIVDSLTILVNPLSGQTYSGSFFNNTIINGSSLDFSSITSFFSHQIENNIFNSSIFVVANDQPNESFRIIQSIFQATVINFNSADGLYFLRSFFSGSTVNISALSFVESQYVDINSGSVLNFTTGGITKRKFNLDYVFCSSNSQINLTALTGNLGLIERCFIDTDSALNYNNGSGKLSNIKISGDSSASFQNITAKGIADVFIENNSSLVMGSISQTSGNISVKDFSLLTINTSSVSILDFIINDNANVTLNNNSTAKQFITISRWSVTLDPAEVHNNIKLWITDDSAFRPAFTSNVFKSYNYTTKVIANIVQLTSNSVDSYVGIMEFIDISINPVAPSVISGFTNTAVMPQNLIFQVIAKQGGYLQLLQDPIPVASGGIGMTGSITLFGQDGEIPSDSIKLQKGGLSNDRFMQLGYWYFT